MSMPFSGPPILKNINKMLRMNQKLASLKPKRKHYQYYFASYGAANNIMKCKQGLNNFLRSYFYFKSYDYKENNPYRLNSFTAKEISNVSDSDNPTTVLNSSIPSLDPSRRTSPYEGLVRNV